MIVLHALWNRSGAGRLHFWAESSEQAELSQQAVGTGGRGRRSFISGPHPFALAAEALREALGELGGSLLAREAVAGVMTLRLPATTGGPLASPELVREELADTGTPIFASWEVSTLALAADGALDLLLALPVSAPSGSAFGNSLRFWITAARLAYELLARQCYAPALQETDEGEDRENSLRAAWGAALDWEDDARVRELAALMPPVCWSHLPASAKPATLPYELLLHFLNQAIDVFVRARLASHDILPETRKRWSKLTPLPEQWLRALASLDPALGPSRPRCVNSPVFSMCGSISWVWMRRRPHFAPASAWTLPRREKSLDRMEKHQAQRYRTKMSPVQRRQMSKGRMIGT